MNEIAAPRPLNPTEASNLTALLKSHLRLHNCSCAIQAEEDATDLLNYAIDMIEDGASVGKVLEELGFMEMEICDWDVLETMRMSLAEFLARMHKEMGKKNWRDMLHDRENNGSPSAADSYEVQLLTSESHVSVELSAKSAADKHKREMESLFGAGGKKPQAMSSVRQSYQQQLIADRVDNKKERIYENGGRQGGDVSGGNQNVDEMRREELMAIMNDRSLGKNEKSKKMAEVKEKYGQMTSEGKSGSGSVRRISDPKQGMVNGTRAGHFSGTDNSRGPSHFSHFENGTAESADGSDEETSPAPTGGVDLSAKAAAAKHAKEMANLFGKGKRSSLKDRMSMYNEKGEIIKKAQDVEEDTSHFVQEKSTDELRREELMAIMKDKSLDKKEKQKRMEEVRERYGTAAECSAAASSSSYIKSSATSGTTASSTYNRGNSMSSRSSEGTYSHHSNGDESGDDNENPLSAKAAAEKHKREIESLFGRSGGAGNAMSSNRQNYEQQLVADRVNNKLGHEVRRSSAPATNGFKGPHRTNKARVSPEYDEPPPPPTLDQQRRAELQIIMRDSSLKKDERRKKMEEVKEKYKELAAKEEEKSPNIGSSSRRNTISSPPKQSNIDLSAKSYAQRSGNELQNLNIGSLSERKHMYSNQSSIVAGREQQRHY